MKKRRIQLIALMLVLIIAFAGCTKEGGDLEPTQTKEAPNETKESTEEKQTEQTPEQPIVVENNMPISDTPITLKHFCPIEGKHTPFVNTYSELAAFKKIAEVTGIDMVYDVVPAELYEEKLSLMLASQEAYDLVWLNKYTLQGMQYGIDEKIIEPLDYLIEQYAPNIIDWLEAVPKIHDQAALVDGNMYSMPRVDVSSTSADLGFFIKQDWLEQLSLDEPKTYEDFYDILKAFKDNDMNGNGDATDETPFDLQYPHYIYEVFGNMFGFAVASGDWFQVEDDKIYFGPSRPEVKAALEFAHKLYEEELLDNEYLTHGDQLFSTNWIDGNIGCSWGYGSLVSSILVKASDDADAAKNIYSPVSTPQGPDGVAYQFSYVGQVISDSGTAIMAASDYKEEAIRWLDYIFSFEGANLFRWGLEGEAWVYDEENVPRVISGVNCYEFAMGGRANIGAPNIKTPVSEENWPFTEASYDPFDNIIEKFEPANLYDTKYEKWQAFTLERQLPLFFKLPAEHTELRVQALADAQAIFEEYFNKVVMGIEPVEKWDDVVGMFESIGVPELIEAMQESYDSLYKK